MLGRDTVGSNLESVLMDQKLRADKHRMNFDTLRSQHIVLQEVGRVEGVGRRWSGVCCCSWQACAANAKRWLWCDVGVTPSSHVRTPLFPRHTLHGCHCISLSSHAPPPSPPPGTCQAAGGPRGAGGGVETATVTLRGHHCHSAEGERLCHC